MNRLLVLVVIIIFVLPTSSQANPADSGVSGLIHIPSADTLDAGNVCLGLWSDVSSKDGSRSTIVPASLTLGLGTFWEMYGTYPNLLINGQEERSGRGAAVLGTKLRFWGNRNSSLKLAMDFSAQKSITKDGANNPTDLGTRLVASLKGNVFGVHVFTGYLYPGDKTKDNKMLYGGGVEYAPTTRSRILAEVFDRNTSPANGNPLEASLGFQFYLSPHLTFNAAGSVGLSGASPDWRTVVGFTTCQGIGSYIKPVPALTNKPTKDTKTKQGVRAVKIIPITPLLLKSFPSTTKVSKLEVPLDSDGEEIVIKPYGQIIIPSQQTINPIALRPKFAPTHPQQAQTGLPTVTKVQVQQATAATPILSPVKLPLEVSGTDLGDQVEIKDAKSGYPLDLIEGVTPLYGVEIKGEKSRLVAMLPVQAQPEQIPEKMVVYRKFRFADGKFEFNMANLSDEVKKSISEAAEQIRNDKNWVYLRIDGHTDGMGSLDYNMDLSLKRAIAIASYLITKEGIDPRRVFVKGMGKTKHISDNSTAEGRRINRRFEILFLVPKDK